jgi:hypothetical protein
VRNQWRVTLFGAPKSAHSGPKLTPIWSAFARWVYAPECPGDGSRHQRRTVAGAAREGRSGLNSQDVRRPASSCQALVPVIGPR